MLLVLWSHESKDGKLKKLFMTQGIKLLPDV